MHIRKKFFLTITVLLAGCTGAPVTNIAPLSPQEYSSDSKLPGKYALVVDAESLHGLYHPVAQKSYSYPYFTEEPPCTLHTFPYDIRKSYTRLLLDSLKTSLQTVELSTESDVAEKNYDAVILVSTENMGFKFNTKKHPFITNAIAYSSITSTFKVLVNSEERAKENFNATRNYTGPMGWMCSKVPEAMTTSIEHSSHETSVALLKFVRATLTKVPMN